MPEYTEDFYTVTTIGGPLKLYGFHLDFNSDRVIVRVERDGVLFFEVDCQDLEDRTPVETDDMQMTTGMWLSWLRSGDHFVFKPDYPIYFSSSLSIKVKANSNNDDRELDGWQVNYEEVL